MSYQLYGMEVSPYSIKVRSYLRYKNIPHTWVIRSMAVMETFQQYAKLPLVPLLITPEDKGMQDSTPIIEKLETQFSENSLSTGNKSLDFISALIEEYADEWGNKPMFHYRWAYDDNVVSTADRIAREQLGPDAEVDQIDGVRNMISERMTGRLHVVGSSEATRDIIENSYKNVLRILEAHFATGREYLLGGRPVMADFGLYAQLYEMYTDPVSKSYMDENSPLTRDWCLRMLNPENKGEVESWETLSVTLLPLLQEEVAALFLPWSQANTDAALAGAAEFNAELAVGDFAQSVVKYAVKSLASIKAKYQAIDNRSELDLVLEAMKAKSYF